MAAEAAEHASLASELIQVVSLLGAGVPTTLVTRILALVSTLREQITQPRRAAV